MLLSYIRTVLLYLVLVRVIRIMGKRQIGEMEPAEFVVTMLVANLASIPMQDSGIPLLSGLVPILTVLGVELVLSAAAMGSIRFRRMLCGKPVILIENGRGLQENLRKTRVTQDELTGHLREKNVLDMTTVQYAILETNGQVSVFPFPKHLPASARDAGIQAGKQSLPVTIICDGTVLTENLSVAGKTGDWLRAELKKREATIAGTWYLAVDSMDKVLFIPMEEKKK